MKAFCVFALEKVMNLVNLRRLIEQDYYFSRHIKKKSEHLPVKGVLGEKNKTIKNNNTSMIN